MATFAILGSGFGLYGYLPALIRAGVQRIVLPERYQTRLFDRQELIPFASNIEWEADEDSVLDRAEGVVLALRPSDQSKWIPRCLTRSNIKNMLLEKPLAHSPETATKILEALIRSGKVFRTGYTFRYTTWGKQLLSSLGPKKGECDALSISWIFLAHHFHHDLNTWKRFDDAGGGALRFYGIQIIALLAEIGYCNVTSSQAFGTSSNELEKWSAVFQGSGLPVCKIQVNTRSTVSKFQIEQTFNTNVGSKTIAMVDQSDPFDEVMDSTPLVKTDRRVPLLSQLYNSLSEKSAHYNECYEATIKLWHLVEEKTKFEAI